MLLFPFSNPDLSLQSIRSILPTTFTRLFKDISEDNPSYRGPAILAVDVESKTFEIKPGKLAMGGEFYSAFDLETLARLYNHRNYWVSKYLCYMSTDFELFCSHVTSQWLWDIVEEQAVKLDREDLKFLLEGQIW